MHQSRGTNIGLVLVAAGVLGCGWLFLRTPATEPVVNTPHPTARIQPQTPAPAPYNGNFAILPELPTDIPRTAFATTNFNLSAKPATSSGVRSLQIALQRFGIYKGAPTGTLDAVTKASLRLVSSITGTPADTVESGQQALQSAQSRAEENLWMLGVFPLGKTLPSWLLASLDTDDLQTLQDAFSKNLDADGGIFTVRLKTRRLIVHARLFPASTTYAPPGCRAFSALFELDTLQHHVIARACRGSDAHWAMETHE